MSSLPQVAEAIHAVLTDVPEALARATGFCVRRSKFTGAAFVETLVLGWWQEPAATLSELSQTAAVRGYAISPQGLDQRFGPAGAALLRDRLEAAVAAAIAAAPAAGPLLARFPAVLLLDSTTVALPDALATLWPGCGGRLDHGGRAGLKATVRLDLVTGALEGPALDAARTQDRATALQRAPVPAGALRIADRGYWSLGVLAEIAAQGAYFLTRYQRQTAVALDGVWLDLPAWLAARTDAVLDLAVELGKTARLPARLLALRVPQGVADERRRKANAEAKREGEAPPPAELANWTLLVTNAAGDLLSAAETAVLARMRWQIELLFKLWKDEAKLDESRSADPDRVLCEVYAKLLVVVLQHWVLLVGGWTPGDRSLVRAIRPVRAAGLPIALALADVAALTATLTALLPAFAAGGRVAKRRKRPNAAQLLADPGLAYA